MYHDYITLSTIFHTKNISILISKRFLKIFYLVLIQYGIALNFSF